MNAKQKTAGVVITPRAIAQIVLAAAVFFALTFAVGSVRGYSRSRGADRVAMLVAPEAKLLKRGDRYLLAYRLSDASSYYVDVDKLEISTNYAQFHSAQAAHWPVDGADMSTPAQIAAGIFGGGTIYTASEVVDRLQGVPLKPSILASFDDVLAHHGNRQMVMAATAVAAVFIGYKIGDMSGFALGRATEGDFKSASWFRRQLTRPSTWDYVRRVHYSALTEKLNAYRAVILLQHDQVQPTKLISEASTPAVAVEDCYLLVQEAEAGSAAAMDLATRASKVCGEGGMYRADGSIGSEDFERLVTSASNVRALPGLLADIKAYKARISE